MNKIKLEKYVSTIDLVNKFKNDLVKNKTTYDEFFDGAYKTMSAHQRGHNINVKNYIKKHFFEYLQLHPISSINSSDQFDNWYRNFISSIKQNKPSGISFNLTVGLIQKFTNMFFKYWYASNVSREEINHIIEYLHMTLDNYTLNWYKKYVRNIYEINYSTQNLDSWSKINNIDDYFKVQENIRNYLRDNQFYQTDILDLSIKYNLDTNIPFLSEFCIWEGENINVVIGALKKNIKVINKESSLVPNELKESLRSIIIV